MSNNERTFMVEYLFETHGQDYKVPANMTMNKSFKQFFTPQKYSQVMIEQLNFLYPKKIIDLSMGEGSLLIEAMNVWKYSMFFGNDIDEKCCLKIKNNYPNISCSNKDIFKIKTINNLIKSYGEMDLCLANPPFDLIVQSEDIISILKQYGLEKTYKTSKIPAEIIFILQCLTILSDKGTLAIILPDGFFVNNYLKPFRKFLLENYQINKITELPENIFKKTDAKTHILILTKDKPFKKILLYKDAKTKPIKIKIDEAYDRMDYDYYKNNEEFKAYQFISNFNIIFKRGQQKFLIQDIKEEHILHTTNFSKTNHFRNRLRSDKQLLKYKNQIAIEGDIIFCRVGSYCLGKVGIVEKGFFVATDCVFIIRIKDINLRQHIYNSLISKQGQKWIKANSKGVSAKHITLEDIKKFPYIMDN